MIRALQSMAQAKALMTDLGINLYSILVIVATVTTEMLNKIPNWMVVILVASVVFMNVARGISYLRKKKKDKQTPEQ